MTCDVPESRKLDKEKSIDRKQSNVKCKLKQTLTLLVSIQAIHDIFTQLNQHQTILLASIHSKFAVVAKMKLYDYIYVYSDIITYSRLHELPEKEMRELIKAVDKKLVTPFVKKSRHEPKKRRSPLILMPEVGMEYHGMSKTCLFRFARNVNNHWTNKFTIVSANNVEKYSSQIDNTQHITYVEFGSSISKEFCKYMMDGFDLIDYYFSSMYCVQDESMGCF